MRADVSQTVALLHSLFALCKVELCSVGGAFHHAHRRSGAEVGAQGHAVDPLHRPFLGRDLGGAEADQLAQT